VLVLRDPLGKKLFLWMILYFSFKGPGSNKPPEDPFGDIAAEKNTKKILSMICR